MARRRVFNRLLLSLVVAAALFLVAIIWRPSIPLDTAEPAFSHEQTARGAQLAAIGNCITCHTKPGGAAFAGGRAIATPFGTVYSTNVTPDRETGIGGWTEAAFRRAMKDGVSRDGRHLYPAFPYDHMTRMRDDDIRAVYAFIMTRRPVLAVTPANDLEFPFSIRALIAGWKLLFLDRGELPPDASRDFDHNRGAYLVEGLGHCSACHTPRNALGAEKRDQAYAGGESEGWIAPALNAASPAAVPWDAARLYNYLRHGFDDMHGVAAGPMAPVVKNLEAVPESDVRAIAAYVAHVASATPPERQAQARNVLARVKGERSAPAAADQPGAEIYAGTCAQCHGERGRSPPIRAMNLALSSTLRMPQPSNVIRIVREGIHPQDGGAGPVMPGFGAVLTDRQLAALVAFLRSNFAERPPWDNIGAEIEKAKKNATREARSAQ